MIRKLVNAKGRAMKVSINILGLSDSPQGTKLSLLADPGWKVRLPSRPDGVQT
ncbi:hypothetical protein [Paenibacillus sp. LPE1-1-1.1]|uniref:hypothetical protein n=1 Tax=Paenibacillus sp. LPE1-1-1.1 TaxID=3135230 RepID=UPI0034426D5F